MRIALVVDERSKTYLIVAPPSSVLAGPRFLFRQIL